MAKISMIVFVRIESVNDSSNMN